MLCKLLNQRARRSTRNLDLDACITQLATPSVMYNVVMDCAALHANRNMPKWPSLVSIALAYPDTVSRHTKYVPNPWNHRIQRICDVATQKYQSATMVAHLLHDMGVRPQLCSTWDIAYVLKQYWNNLAQYTDTCGNNICHACAYQPAWSCFLPDLWRRDYGCNMMEQTNVLGETPLHVARAYQNLSCLNRWKTFCDLVVVDEVSRKQASKYLQLMHVDKNLADFPAILPPIQQDEER